jgi:hypothetical protein
MDPTPENLRELADGLVVSYHVVPSMSSPSVDAMRAAADRIEALERLVRAMWLEVPVRDSNYLDHRDWERLAVKRWDPDALELARVLTPDTRNEDTK